MSDVPQKPAKQLLHLVFGGELSSLGSTEFKDLDELDIVGVYPNYASAYAARPRLSALSIMRSCGISSCTCTGCSIQKTTHRSPKGKHAVQGQRAMGTTDRGDEGAC
jgi:Domain of unknown function (DUF4170)